MGIIIQDKPAEFMPSAPGQGGKFLAPGSTKMFRPQPEPPGKAKMGFEPSPFMPKGASLGPEGGTPVGITPEPERGEGGSPVAVSSEPLPRAPEMMPQGAGEKGIIILNKPGQGSEKMGIIVSDRPAEFIPSAPGKGSEKMGIIVSDKPGPAGGEKGIIVIGTEPGEGAAPGLGGMGEKGIIIINKPGLGGGEKGIIINSAPTPAGK